MILPDVLAPGLHLVLCGTAPSRASKEAQAYYAKPGNAFWPTLHAVGLTPERIRPADYRRVLEFGIGLTDLNKTEFGVDSELSRSAYDVEGFKAKMRAFRPAAIALDSKNAGSSFHGGAPVAYGRQPDFEGIAVFVVPSPSGLARRFFQLEPWAEVGAYVRERRGW
ncbi:MAG TPA: mismatch-specific DNA-glycosylase [Azospirillaceae bacterium]|nr:mismatch-specific DNA-glycosylase [Azospirillaceae bacterium]